MLKKLIVLTACLSTGAQAATISSVGNGPNPFSAYASCNKDYSYDTCVWNWGDGSKSEGTSVTHTYSSVGVKSVSLTVKTPYWPEYYSGSGQVTISDFKDMGRNISGLYGSMDGSPERIKTIDYDVDGKEDILIGPDGNGKWYILRNTGASFQDYGAVISGKYGNWDGAGTRIRVYDYNSDGKDDVLIGPDGYGNWYVLKNNGGSFVDAGKIISGMYGSWDRAGDRIRVIDYDNDGRDDILLGPDASGTWYAIKNGSAGFQNKGAIIYNSYGNWQGAGNRIRVMHLNNDQWEDILIGPDGYGNWHALINEGGYFSNRGNWATGMYGNMDRYPERIKTLDADGDGDKDVLIGPDGNGFWYMMENTRNGFRNRGGWIAAPNYKGWDGAGSAWRIRPVNINRAEGENLLIGPNAYGEWWLLQNQKN